MSSVTGGIPVADFPFSPTATPAVDAVRLSAALDLTGAGWIGVGFSSAPSQGLFGGQLGVLVNRLTSSLEIWINGTTTRIANVAIPNLMPGFNTLDVTYSRSANTISALVNHRLPTPGFLIDLDTLPGGSFVPNIQHVYFQFFNPTSLQSTMESFWVNRPPLLANGFESGSIATWTLSCPPDCGGPTGPIIVLP